MVQAVVYDDGKACLECQFSKGAWIWTGSTDPCDGSRIFAPRRQRYFQYFNVFKMADSFPVALMDLGYVTHGVHANSRLVYLPASLSADQTILTITGPPNAKIWPPGPGWLYLVVGGVPSTAR